MSDRAITISRRGTQPRVDVDLIDLVDTRLLVQANSGGGKSWLLRLLAEKAGDKLQTIILDPEGEFYTLREALDMVLIGSEGADLPADPRSAGLLARRLLESQVSAVIDLYELKIAERRRFVRLFLESLIHLPRALWRPTLVILDEAHMFCPERGAGEAESTEAVIGLLSQGRKRGYCGALATQRLSKLHKDAAAECNNVLIGRTGLDVDQIRAGDMLGMSKADRLKLRELEAGQWYGFGPAFSLKSVFSFHAGDLITTHPKAGERHKLIAPAPSVKVRKVLAQLVDLPQQAAAEIRTLEDAKREITRIELENRKLRSGAPKPADVTDQKAIDRAVREAVTRLEREHGQKIADHERLIRVLARDRARVRQILDDAKAFIAPLDPTDERVPTRTADLGTGRREDKPRPRPAESFPAGHRPQHIESDGEPKLKLGERKMLVVLATFHPESLTRDQIGTMIGLPAGGSTFGVYLSTNKRAGYVIEDMVGLSLTDSGVVHASTMPVLSKPCTTDELVALWNTRLKKGEREMLQQLVEAYPHSVTREDLGEAIGLPYTGSTFGVYLSTLVRNRLALKDHLTVIASHTLFPRMVG